VGRHAAYVMAGMQLRAWMQALCDAWTDVIMVPLPLFHVYANVGVQAMAFVGRNPMSLVPNPRDIDDVLKTIRKVRPAFFTSVPTLFTALLAHREVRDGRADFSSIKLCFSGASALLVETKRQFETLTGGRILEGYSLTEAMMACTANPARGQNKTGSIGLPLPDVDVLIVDGENPDQVLEIGQVGEVLVRAPATDGTVLEQRRTKPRSCCASARRGAPGCTRAISDTWTRTATSSSWTARKI
jgi:long-chain acyl-CoA synthetase